ncbi:MAG: molybdopterin-dependent oxidoreductase [Candidatus Tectomicrobia bacterium]|nr:molybdopterin-dependent oxidoreductase [Candidatus Tectomicrobia bacterium]
MRAYRVVGQRVARIDAREKVTGHALYADDVILPGMLYGKVIRSPHAHARIVHIDAGAALRRRGVKAVVTGRDFPDVKFGFTKPTQDRRALPIDKVRYIGEGVAAVAATDKDLAAEAADLVRIDYEELPAVFDPEEAMKPGAPRLHEHAENNVSAICRFNFGDIEEAFRVADHVREDSFSTQAIMHGYLEPFAIVARYEVVTDRATLWAAKQSPYIIYRNLARGLGMKPSQLRIIQPHVGGGFGGKHEPFDLDFSAVMLSKMTGKPVKITCDMEEVFLSAYRRHPMRIRLAVAARRDGTLLGYRCRLIADGGAYAGVGHMSIYLAGAFLSLPFKVPNLRYDADRVYTNKPFSGALRGHGIPQMRFAAESQLDALGRDLGLDPLDIRMRNRVRQGDKLANGFVVTSCGLTESLELAAEAVDWTHTHGTLRRRGAKVRGIGLGCGSLSSGSRMGGHDASTAVIRVHEDGKVHLLHGSPDVGQGSNTVLAQILAEELGLTMDDIQTTLQDSDFLIFDPGTYGSRVTFTTGAAVRTAAAEIRRQLFEAVSKEIECAPGDLICKEGRIVVRGNEDRGVSFLHGVRLCYYKETKPLMAHGSATPAEFTAHFGDPKQLTSGYGNLSGSYSFTTQGSEVEVDLETGEISVLHFASAHDCGYPINPTLVEGQLDGSVAGGLGQALFENLETVDGLLLTPNFTDYGLPTSMESPQRSEHFHIETDDQFGPYGAKESGEGTQISTLPSIVNAIYDATGIWFRHLPITPDKVVKALQETYGANYLDHPFFNDPAARRRSGGADGRGNGRSRREERA